MYACQAVCFCGTFLEIALTGRYPAFCSVEFGLSSNLAARDCLCSSNLPDKGNIVRTGCPEPMQTIPASHRMEDLEGEV